MTSVRIAWTWWLPLLGVFILDWALLGIVLRGGILIAPVGHTMVLLVEVVWQWLNPRLHPPNERLLVPVFAPMATLTVACVRRLAAAAISSRGIGSAGWGTRAMSRLGGVLGPLSKS